MERVTRVGTRSLLEVEVLVLDRRRTRQRAELLVLEDGKAVQQCSLLVLLRVTVERAEKSSSLTGVCAELQGLRD